MMPRPRETEKLRQAGVLYQAGHLQEAEQIARNLIRKNRSLADGYQLLGLIAVRHRRYDEAVRHYKTALKIKPHSPRIMYLLAKAYTALGNIEEAVGWFDRTLKEKPGDPETLAWKAVVLERGGKVDEAAAIIQPFTDSGNETTLMAETWARIAQRRGEYDKAIEIARKHIAKAETDRLSRHVLSFLAAKCLEKSGRYDEAFAAYEEANRILAVPFSHERYRAEIDKLIETFSAEAFEKLPCSGIHSHKPVFIAGLARSGTTLVERVIDAHPLGFGAGEITDIEDMANNLPTLLKSDIPYPACVAEMTKQHSLNMARQYLKHLEQLAGRRAARVVNKSLDNWMNLGFIALLFPGAKVIHCRRDPMDNCMSCFMSELMPGKYPFASRLADLGFVYREHERLMDHWRKVLPLEIHEVSYEGNVKNPEKTMKGIIEFLDLEWDERCIQFHKNARPATTLSYDQVQKPVYTSSVGRAGHFATHIDELRQALKSEE